MNDIVQVKFPVEFTKSKERNHDYDGEVQIKLMTKPIADIDDDILINDSDTLRQTHIDSLKIDQCRWCFHKPHLLYWLVVWNFFFLFLNIYGNKILLTDELIFFRGVGIPPTSNKKHPQGPETGQSGTLAEVGSVGEPGIYAAEIWEISTRVFWKIIENRKYGLSFGVEHGIGQQ